MVVNNVNSASNCASGPVIHPLHVLSIINAISGDVISIRKCASISSAEGSTRANIGLRSVRESFRRYDQLAQGFLSAVEIPHNAGATSRHGLRMHSVVIIHRVTGRWISLARLIPVFVQYKTNSAPVILCPALDSHAVTH